MVYHQKQSKIDIEMTTCTNYARRSLTYVWIWEKNGNLACVMEWVSYALGH